MLTILFILTNKIKFYAIFMSKIYFIIFIIIGNPFFFFFFFFLLPI